MPMRFTTTISISTWGQGIIVVAHQQRGIRHADVHGTIQVGTVRVVVAQAYLPVFHDFALNRKIGLLRQGVLEAFLHGNREGQ